MPLNTLQRQTLYSTVTSYIDAILESNLEHLLKIEALNAIINPTLPSLDVVLQTLRQRPELVQGLVEAVNVPQDTRRYWADLLQCIRQQKVPPNSLLKSLQTISNYNPFLMTAMSVFEDNLKSRPEISSIATELICLREAYLEMTPLASYSYGQGYRTFRFRIGIVPFNLDQCGPVPLPGEIQADIERYITDRIEQADKYQKALEEQATARHVLETGLASMAMREQNLSVAVSLLLEDIEDQQRRQQLKHQMETMVRVHSEPSTRPLNLSALLFQRFPRPQVDLYLWSKERLESFEISSIQNGIVLCFDPAMSTSSEGARFYQAYFIEQGQWVTQSGSHMVINLGNLNFLSREEGLLAYTEYTAEIIRRAQEGRRALLGSIPQAAVLPNQRFFEMQGNLNNRITDMMHSVQQTIIELDRTLKNSSQYLEFRKAEFLKVLLDVQYSILESTLTDPSKNLQAINEHYQQQLLATYNMYMEDICAKRIEESRRFSKDSETRVSMQTFRDSITRIMVKPLEELKRFQFNARLNLSKLHGQLTQQRKQQTALCERLKSDWNAAVVPLESLSQEFARLKILRQSIQSHSILDWYEPLNTLHEIALKILKEPPDMLDKASLTWLHYAAWTGNLALMSRCMTTGNQVMTLSSEGYSALHFAAESMTDSIPLLEQLLAGVPKPFEQSLTLTTRRGKTLLHLAAKNGQIGTLCWLTAHCPSLSINTTDKQGITPLHEAARYGHTAVVCHLLKVGANDRLLTQQKESPILLAILGGYVETVRAFFEQGIWLNRDEIGYCLKVIEQHPDPSAMIDSLAVAFTDTAQALSTLKIKSHSISEIEGVQRQDRESSLLLKFNSMGRSSTSPPPMPSQQAVMGSNKNSV